jgi:hypothetical protein
LLLVAVQLSFLSCKGLMHQTGWLHNLAPAFLLNAIQYGTQPSISILSLEKAKAALPGATSNPAFLGDIKGSRPAGWDLSTASARKQSAAEYRQTQAFKDKRAEKRRAQRAITGPQARAAAAEEMPTALPTMPASSTGTGYMGSLTKQDRSATEGLWQPAARAEAEFKLLPVPYELSSLISQLPGLPLIDLKLQPFSPRPYFSPRQRGKAICRQVIFL